MVNQWIKKFRRFGIMKTWEKVWNIIGLGIVSSFVWTITQGFYLIATRGRYIAIESNPIILGIEILFLVPVANLYIVYLSYKLLKAMSQS